MRTDLHGRVFGLAAGLGVSGLLVVGAAMATAVASLHRTSVGAGSFSVAVVELSYPRLNVAAATLLTLGTLGAIVVAIALRACWRQHRFHRRFIARLAVVGSLERILRSPSSPIREPLVHRPGLGGGWPRRGGRVRAEPDVGLRRPALSQPGRGEHRVRHWLSASPAARSIRRR
jgi:hypothetical protein